MYLSDRRACDGYDVERRKVLEQWWVTAFELGGERRQAMLGAWSRSIASSCCNRGGMTSESAASNCPSFTNVGPSSSSACRSSPQKDCSSSTGS